MKGSTAGLFVHLTLGTLTGKYLNGAKPAGARNTLFSRFTRYRGEQTQKAVQQTTWYRQDVDHLDPTTDGARVCTPSTVCCQHSAGRDRDGSLKTNIESLHLELSEDVLAEIEAVHQVYTYPAP